MRKHLGTCAAGGAIVAMVVGAILWGVNAAVPRCSPSPEARIGPVYANEGVFLRRVWRGECRLGYLVRYPGDEAWAPGRKLVGKLVEAGGPQAVRWTEEAVLAAARRVELDGGQGRLWPAWALMLGLAGLLGGFVTYLARQGQE